MKRLLWYSFLLLWLNQPYCYSVEVEEEKESEDIHEDISSPVPAPATINVNAQDDMGNTPLHRALHAMRIKDIEHLLQQPSINLGLTNQQGENVVHLWASNANIPAAISELFTQRTTFKDGLLNSRDIDGNTPLHRAIESFHTAIIPFLVTMTDISLKNNAGNTPAHSAARIGNSNAIMQMVKKDSAILNSQNNDGNTPLHIAVANGHNNLVTTLLQYPQTNASLGNDNGSTPLHLAIVSTNPIDHPTLMKLIEQTNLQSKDARGNTPLHSAVFANKPLIIEAIVAQDSIVDRMNNVGNTPLHIAAEQQNVPLVQYLLDHGANANALNQGEQKPIDMARHEAVTALLKPRTVTIAPKDAQQKISYGVKTHNKKLVEEGIAQGGNVNQQDEHGETPLHSATRLDDTQIADTLLQNNADPTIPNNDQETPVHMSVDAHPELFQKVLEQTPAQGLTMQDRNGDTPLHRAAKRKNSQKAQALLNADKSGASVEIQNYEGKSADQVTHITEINNRIKKKRKLSVRGLLAAGKIVHAMKAATQKKASDLPVANATSTDSSDLQAMLAAIAKGDETHVTDLLAKKIIIPTTKMANGSTPLHEAIKKGDAKLVARFLQENPDLLVKNAENQTILELAIQEQQAQIAQQIIDYARTKGILSSLLEQKTETAATLLHIACQKGNKNLIDTLLRASVSRAQKDDKGQLPLHRAVSNADATPDIVNLLLGKTEKFGLNVPDNDGNTPLHLAIQHGAIEAAKLLIQLGAAIVAENMAGITPFMLCAQKSNRSLFELLMNRASHIYSATRIGAALYIEDGTGKTVLDYIAPLSNATDFTTLLNSRQLPTDPQLHDFLNPYYLETIAKNRQAFHLLQDASNNARLPIAIRNRIRTLLLGKTLSSAQPRR